MFFIGKHVIIICSLCILLFNNIQKEAMKAIKTCIVSTLIILGSSMFSVASARVIDFDDIIVNHKPSYARPINGYQGVRWINDNWMISDKSDG